MRIYVLTQEDAFYIPRILDHLFAARPDVVGVGIVPGELRGSSATKYLRMMGVRDFSLQVLNLVRHRVMDVVSRVVPSHRGWSVAGSARRAHVPIEIVRDVNAATFLASLRERGVDLIVSVACPQRLKRELLALPRHGCINLHGALLPRYQGMLPSFWVLARGERETGVTVHWMDEALDRGDVLLQERVPIEAADTMHSLVTRSKVEMGRHLLLRAIEAIERGDAGRQPMDLANASYHSFPDAAAVREFRARGRRFI